MDWKVIALRNVAFRRNLEIFGAYVSERPVLPEFFLSMIYEDEKPKQ